MQILNVTSFDTDGICSWDEQVFSGETVYELVELDGFSVLKASSHNSASGLALKIRSDLLRYAVYELELARF